MTRGEADELRGFIEGLGGCESVAVRPARRGYKLTVRMVGEPPRTFTNPASAFAAYCGAPDEDDQ
jgi:hypothetical protein